MEDYDQTTGTPLRVRERDDADIGACEELAREVHALDGYPPYLPRNDFGAFLVSAEALTAWVAEDLDGIVGHVALHSRSSQPVMDAVGQALSCTADRIGVVARLLVKPEARRRGVGRRLLDVSSAAALTQGRRAVLDVATQFNSAIRLYEAAGWHRVAQVTVPLPGEGSLEEFVYVAPLPQG